MRASSGVKARTEGVSKLSVSTHSIKYFHYGLRGSRCVISGFFNIFIDFDMYFMLDLYIHVDGNRLFGARRLQYVACGPPR